MPHTRINNLINKRFGIIMFRVIFVQITNFCIDMYSDLFINDSYNVM